MCNSCGVIPNLTLKYLYSQKKKKKKLESVLNPLNLLVMECFCMKKCIINLVEYFCVS